MSDAENSALAVQYNIYSLYNHLVILYHIFCIFSIIIGIVHRLLNISSRSATLSGIFLLKV